MLDAFGRTAGVRPPASASHSLFSVSARRWLVGVSPAGTNLLRIFVAQAHQHERTAFRVMSRLLISGAG